MLSPQLTDEEIYVVKRKAQQIGDLVLELKHLEDENKKQSRGISSKDSKVEPEKDNNIGAQFSAMEKIIQDVLSDISNKYGKDVAHRVRQDLDKSGNKALALKLALEKYGIQLTESFKLDQIMMLRMI